MDGWMDGWMAVMRAAIIVVVVVVVVSLSLSDSIRHQAAPTLSAPPMIIQTATSRGRGLPCACRDSRRMPLSPPMLLRNGRALARNKWMDCYRYRHRHRHRHHHHHYQCRLMARSGARRALLAHRLSTVLYIHAYIRISIMECVCERVRERDKQTEKRAL